MSGGARAAAGAAVLMSRGVLLGLRRSGTAATGVNGLTAAEAAAGAEAGTAAPLWLPDPVAEGLGLLLRVSMLLGHSPEAMALAPDVPRRQRWRHRRRAALLCGLQRFGPQTSGPSSTMAEQQQDPTLNLNVVEAQELEEHQYAAGSKVAGGECAWGALLAVEAGALQDQDSRGRQPGGAGAAWRPPPLPVTGAATASAAATDPYTGAGLPEGTSGECGAEEHELL